MKCATVSVIGRPSAGKSTMVNTICGMKVSITAATPQTTRNAIRGIYTDQRGQIIFTDTPGYHLGGRTINQKMQQITKDALTESDIILYLIDGKRAGGEEEKAICTLIREIKKVPVVAVINKSDILTDEEKSAAEEFLKENLPRASVLSASGKVDEGVDEVLIELFRLAPEGELLYSEDAYTDQPLEFRISEIIREKTINLLKDELPHVIYVDVADIEYNAEESAVWVRAIIYTERENQKGIVVGKGGENIKKIRKQSFNEIRKIFPGSQLSLDLRVKADAGWRTNENILTKLFRPVR